MTASSDSREVWKDIPGYEGKYQASTLGRIRSVDRIIMAGSDNRRGAHLRRYKGVILHPGKTSKDGHLSVVLGRGKKGSLVHRLVAETFLGPVPDFMEVLHTNGNPADNRLENLRYGTRTMNIYDVYYQGKAWRKLTADDVRKIRSLVKSGTPDKEIAPMFGISKYTVAEIRKGNAYGWLT